ncbi:MAG TPA: epoxide hydrolase [Candidatus Sulfotelmatobacter sp.]|nr:epoxide hydrolase [Candidatus Sulfotelmatobacter sp.]
MKFPRTDAALEEQSMNNDLENRTGVPAPLTSRRTFIRAAAATGGAGILSAGMRVSAQGIAAKAEQMVLPTTTKEVTSFKVHIPQAALDDLKKRLANARWPDKEPVTDWSQGVPLAKAQALAEYWRTRYDWRVAERTLNGLAQFRTQIDGLGIYFIHVRSKHENALPIILTHGWPGSIIEFMQVIGPLVDPTAHGGTADEAFHVVIPSLPGFGFSDKPTEPGWRLPRIANAWAALMARLGYSRYVAQGGDLGAGVSSWMAKQQPAGLVAIHLNLPILFPPPPAPPGGYTAAEQPALAELGKYASDASGYASIQTTRPQTLGYGLADSPVGQAMWIYEKFQAWSDHKGDPAEAISVDHMLDDITLYWLTDTAASSARLYYESFAKDFARMPLELPVAVSIFKGDFFTPPKVWGEETYSKLFYWNEVPKGGHFAALEQPDLFVAELRKSFAQVR